MFPIPVGRLTIALVLFALMPQTGAGQAPDPVTAFIVRADSIATAAGDGPLAGYVARKSSLVGAAVGQLLDVALQVGDAGDPAAEAENIEFARRLSRLYERETGSETLRELVDIYANWTPEQRGERNKARAMEQDATGARNGGDFDRAVALLNEARSIYEGIDDRRSQAVIWGSLGVVYWYAGDFDSVFESYDKALAARRAIEDRILEGKTLNGLGSANLQTGNLERAVEFYSRAIRLRRETGDVRGLGTSLTYIGSAYERLGRLVDARESLEEALDILERSGEPHQRVGILNGIASLYSAMGRLNGANDAYGKAIDLAARSGDAGSEASCRINLGINLRLQGRYRESLEQFETVEQLLAQQPDPFHIAALHRERGLTNRSIGELDAARVDLVECLRQSENIEDPTYRIEALINLGYLYRDFNAYERALESAHEARGLAEEAGASRLVRDATVLAAEQEQSLGRLESAVQLWQAALEQDRTDGFDGHAIQDEVGLANALALMGRKEDARRRYREVRHRLEPSGLTEFAQALHLGIGHTFEGDNPDSASHHYEQALHLLEQARAGLGGQAVQTGFLSGERRYIYEEVARYYASLHARDESGGWSSRAFRTMERAKARGLLDLMEESVRAQSSDSEEALLDSLYRIDTANAAGKKIRRRLEKRYADVREERIQRSFGGMATGHAIVALRDVRKLLPRGTALLEYALGDTASLLWVVDRKGHDLHELPNRMAIRADVERLRDAIRRPGPGDHALRKTARTLYEKLVLPAESRLSRVKHLVIVPDGFLFEVPFEVLLTKDTREDAGWGELPFLARSYATVYAPSASVFAALERSKRRATYRSELLALGDPDFSTLASSPAAASGLTRLPYTRSEVTSIAARIRADRKEVLLGEEANERRLKSNLRAGSPRILHLATHGLVDPVEPTSSCIALGTDAASEEDGYLHTLEILALPLDVGLVVVSACESGRGKVSRGEGVVGLSRAFIASGAKGVVASLWPVADVSTNELMKTFYDRMVGRKHPAARALKEARLALLDTREYSHPFYWSPFIVIGARHSPW